MDVLIICNPEEGNATELCLFLKTEAEKINRRVVLLSAESETRSPSKFDAVIVVASIHGKGYSHTVTNYLCRYHGELSSLPTLFVSVYNSPDENDLTLPDEMQNIASNYLLKVGLVPQHIFQVVMGTDLRDNKYVALADWPKIKLTLQQFLIRNDVMMTG